MNLERFVSQRATQWGELESLLGRCDGHPDRLTPSEVLSLSTLYRMAAADLAVARRSFPDLPVTEDLSSLVTRARAVVYSRSERDERARHYLSVTMWRNLRLLAPLLWVSVAITIGSTVLGAVWALADPQSAAGLLPAGAHVSVHTQGAFYGISVPDRGGLAATIFIHNIVVALLVICTGFLWGVPSVILLAYNGLVLGALGALEWRGGGLDQFVRLIVPHGLLELSCFALAGAAGLALARAMIDPGPRTRTDALAATAAPVGSALICVVAFLVCAGTVEGVITPWDLSLPVALAVGLSLCAAFWTTVAVRGRRDDPDRSRPRPDAGQVPRPGPRQGPGAPIAAQTLASAFSRT